ncbi:SDR family NAD(P)-dependent oxidoreductase [Pseudoduganella albidiflava]|uniref:Oxidoreductase n=1 Tax=Pseudoduganella albidiflava TaxID=321983 RepID=A0A411X5Z7_9BURK|nr:SDR family NAD(P)-dependent oxidoreductase [Pseudoduganella albidiflava]QBI04431.1 SDR family NAD(P)-dependent oxidoreductase [Pseudoduganella albidiflava]GGY27192.1 oxidoreductase [Pseudoduganella albidiflava]
MRYLILLLLVAQLGGCATVLSDSERTAVAGKTYVITGASSGFGKGVALELAALRANVVLAARRTDALEAVAAEAEAKGGNALVVTTDVSRQEDVQRLLDAALARFGRVDVWINNAAVGAIGAFDSVPLDDHARIVDVNLKGLIYGSHVAIRQFRKQGAGTLVNIGSVESVIPQAYHATYSATKAATLSLGRSLNEELRLTGAGNIAVATVLPWATDTPFFTHAANYSGGTPRMPLMDEPQKVVDAIVWVSVHPREELAVGWKAKAAYAGARLAPDLAERFSANVAHHYQYETAPPASATAGAVHRLMPGSTGIDGGHRERIERENEERAAARRGD